MNLYPSLKRSLLGLLLLHGLTIQGQEWLDIVDDSLFLQTPNGLIRSDLSGLLDLEGYYIDQEPPGLLYPDDRDFFFNPRLSLFLETRLGEHLYSLVQVRFDRGFDPGVDLDGDARFDEYFLRYTPFDTPVFNIQAGKFATVFGNWVDRHESWDNPFINAPLPYENVVVISDLTPVAGPRGFLGRKNRVDQKRTWVPVIWGPSYATGASVFGTVERFDYALEVKNASLSSRPFAWDPFNVNFEDPTVTGRLGYRPNAAWNIGANASYGSYFLPGATRPVPGPSLDQYAQITVGPDVSFAWRHWQFWAEAFATRFQVPEVGDADTVGYYLEAKYKFSPQWYGALRWNQQFFDKVPDGRGGEERWDRDAWRTDAALGYRFTRHLQAKLQYSYLHENGRTQGEQMVATQLTIKF